MIAQTSPSGSTKEQITRTVYDEQYANGAVLTPYITQLNLRNRVSYVQAIDVDNNSVPPYRTATFYSYDVHGNAGTVLHDYGSGTVMDVGGNRFKLIRYDYDLISGKVNLVSYQPHNSDGYYQQYRYDAENRLISVWTSRDSILWQQDATYHYYRHGPLARIELGDLKVQGVDYAYTVQGWLKSINPSYNNLGGDLYDEDGTTTASARDAYKLSLNYYDDGTYSDYKPINPPTGYVQGNTLPSSARHNLYNGNISSIATNIRALNQPLLYNYQYDQLNRLVSMDAWASNGLFAATGASPMPDYAERYSYDPNGNILSLSRNGTTANSHPLAMDNLSYKYLYQKTNNNGVGEYVPGQPLPNDVDHLTNQLASIRDAVGDASYSNDIDNQNANNYVYDEIGNMNSDTKEGITNITWSVYGKILSVTKNGSNLTYTYDDMGDRISKKVGNITTWYVRDATGNTLATYVQGDNTKNSGNLTQTEVNLYGSNRIGVLNSTMNCSNLTVPLQTVFTRGNKQYELTNHLGNVLETISDKKLQVSTNNNQTVAYYNADVSSASDYYSFGMQMPERTNTVLGYRYGFNGKEMDKDITNGDLDYGARIYDSRVGKFLSIDPLQTKLPSQSPYLFSNNDPIGNIDVEGKYALFIHYMLTKYLLKQAGVSDVKAQLIAHYTSVFADNPAGISSTKQVAHLKDLAIISANIIGAAHSDNPIFIEIGGKISDEEATNNLIYKKGIDYSRTKNSQGESEQAQKWHATRTYSERNTVTKEAAVQRSFEFAWGSLFKSASEGGFEKMEENSSSIQDFAQALHTFQDIYAHGGAVFRATTKNLSGYRSTDGNEHDIDNDSHPSQDQFLNAKYMTQNAIKIFRILGNDIANIKYDDGYISTRGMNTKQVQTLVDKIKSAGYKIESSGANGYNYHK